MDEKTAAQLCVPEDFAEWCRTLPQSVRQRLSIHQLRQIWEGSVREAYRLARPWLDAKGVYHRHNGIGFPSSDACPFCERDRLREKAEQWRKAYNDLGEKAGRALLRADELLRIASIMWEAYCDGHDLSGDEIDDIHAALEGGNDGH